MENSVLNHIKKEEDRSIESKKMVILPKVTPRISNATVKNTPRNKGSESAVKKTHLKSKDFVLTKQMK